MSKPALVLLILQLNLQATHCTLVNLKAIHIAHQSTKKPHIADMYVCIRNVYGMFETVQIFEYKLLSRGRSKQKMPTKLAHDKNASSSMYVCVYV